MPGLKTTDGKRDWSAVPVELLEAVVDVFQHGNEKYERDNWQENVAENPDAYYSAMYRHIAERRRGARVDGSSKLNPLAHVAAGALIMLWRDLNLATKSVSLPDEKTDGFNTRCEICKHFCADTSYCYLRLIETDPLDWCTQYDGCRESVAQSHPHECVHYSENHVTNIDECLFYDAEARSLHCPCPNFKVAERKAEDRVKKAVHSPSMAGGANPENPPTGRSKVQVEDKD